jgi:hypothetical protein
LDYLKSGKVNLLAGFNVLSIVGNHPGILKYILNEIQSNKKLKVQSFFQEDEDSDSTDENGPINGEKNVNVYELNWANHLANNEGICTQIGRLL